LIFKPISQLPSTTPKKKRKLEKEKKVQVKQADQKASPFESLTYAEHPTKAGSVGTQPRLQQPLSNIIYQNKHLAKQLKQRRKKISFGFSFSRTFLRVFSDFLLGPLSDQ
jgi:hypothetical protein